jgi:hypothetical protein
MCRIDHILHGRRIRQSLGPDKGLPKYTWAKPGRRIKRPLIEDLTAGLK